MLQACRPNVAIAECTDGETICVSFIDEQTEARVDSRTVHASAIGAGLHAEPAAAGAALLYALGSRQLSALVIIEPPDAALNHETAKLVARRPVPVFTVPSWAATATGTPREFTSFALITTAFAGTCRLIRRCAEGSVELLGDGIEDLHVLLCLDLEPRETSGDVLTDRLLQDFWSMDGPSGPHERLAALVTSHSGQLQECLSHLLMQLAGYVRAASILADCEAVVCSGEAIEILGEVFDKSFARAFASSGTSVLPVHHAGDAAVRHVGALRCIEPHLRGPGVWAQANGETLRFTLSTARPVEYSVVHPARAAFDIEEDAIAAMIDGRPTLAIIDARVHGIYGTEIDRYLAQRVHCAGMHLINAAERNKTWDQAELVCQSAIDVNLPRDGVILAVGGGVLLDVVGMAASLFRRGVPYLRVPTTLVGIVDVGVGVKHAVNFAGHKNILGAFYPGIGSVNDLRFLKTLPARELACGIAEIVKMGLVRDGDLFLLVEAHAAGLLRSGFAKPRKAAMGILAAAEQSMLEELQPNLFEVNLRRLVDFGHTFSPTIESRSDYQILHGEAVGIDMLLSTFVAVRRRLCDRSLLDRLIALYRRVHLPLSQKIASTDDLVAGLERIRAHRGGILNLVVPTGVGSAEFLQDVAYSEIHHAVEFMGTEDDRTANGP